MPELTIPAVSNEKVPGGILVHIDPDTDDVGLLAACLDLAASQLRLMAEAGMTVKREDGGTGVRLTMKGESESADKPSQDSARRSDLEAGKGRRKKGRSKGRH